MLKGRHVLIVDDQQMIRKIIQVMLARMNPGKVTQAANGDDARQTITTTPPDLIVCDINMSPGNGLELLQSIRSGELGDSSIPVIFLTCNTGTNMVERAVELGANGYLTKPIQPQKLEQVVRSVLTNKANIAHPSMVTGNDPRN